MGVKRGREGKGERRERGRKERKGERKTKREKMSYKPPSGYFGKIEL